MQHINRMPPQAPTNYYRSFVVKAPLSTHFRPASCADYKCDAYLNGWTYRKADLDGRLLHIVTHSGKRYREEELGPGEMYLVFEPGQTCFQQPTHRVSLERPEFYYTGRGDHRSFSIRRAEQMRPEDWVDRFANHLDMIRNVQEKG